MSSTRTRSADVPLALWQLAPHGRGPDTTIRRRLAAEVLDAYLPAGGAVLDLAPHGGDVGHAALAAGSASVVVACPEAGHGLAGFAGTFDLAVALPPESALGGGEPHSPDGLIANAADAIRPGGVAVLCVVGSRPGDSVGTAVSTAVGLGLRYVQHVVALLPGPPDGASGSGDRRVTHADVLVFAKERA